MLAIAEQSAITVLEGKNTNAGFYSVFSPILFIKHIVL